MASMKRERERERERERKPAENLKKEQNRNMATDGWHIRGPSRDTGSKSMEVFERDVHLVSKTLIDQMFLSRTGRRGRDRGGRMSATGTLLSGRPGAASLTEGNMDVVSA
jgi:hypothetical protein